jgi:hypothetical protein
VGRCAPPGNLVAAQAEWIAVAVWPLVVQLTIGRCGSRKDTCRRMRAPSAGCRLNLLELLRRKRGVSFCRMSSARPILPMSCSKGAETDDRHLRARANAAGARSAPTIWLTRSEWPAGVRVARVQRRPPTRGSCPDRPPGVSAFRRRQSTHQLVETRGQQVQLAARARGFDGPAEVTRRVSWLRSFATPC